MSSSHDVSWQTAHTSNNVYQQIDVSVSQCTLQEKSSLTAYLSVHRMQHSNTRPSGDSSEKTLRVKFFLNLLLTERRQNNGPSLQFVITSETRNWLWCFYLYWFEKDWICCSDKSRGSKLRLSHDKTLLSFTPPFSQGEETIPYTCIFSLQMSQHKTQHTTQIQTAIFITFLHEATHTMELFWLICT